ncbi:hypothetical protein LXL04_006969 [Taraxacum kok-saghyz]
MLFLLPSTTFFMNFLHFWLRRTLLLLLLLGAHSSWSCSDTEEGDVQSETSDNRPSMVVLQLLILVVMNGSLNRLTSDFIVGLLLYYGVFRLRGSIYAFLASFNHLLYELPPFLASGNNIVDVYWCALFLITFRH